MQLMNELEQLFPKQPLGAGRSLLEGDFYDTHRRFFDEIDDAYLQAVGHCATDLLLQYGFDWPDVYLKAGLQAAQLRRRPVEGYTTWHDVTYEYLYYFGDSCSFVDSIGFKFFLPAAIKHHWLAIEQHKNTAFIDSFVYRIQREWGTTAWDFDDAQTDYIAQWVKQHFVGLVVLGVGCAERTF